MSDWNGIKDCHSCRFRHCCNRELPPLDEECRHWKLGDCYTCKFFDVDDDEWFKRGCETWCNGGCRKYRRNWKKSLEYLKHFLKRKG